MRDIRIGTRGSELAVAQARIIADDILHTHSDIHIDIVKIKTSGDKNMSPFSSDPSGIKGMFTLELEEALIRHEIDFAVHSLKDLPAKINPALPIAAYSKRGDPRDALVMSNSESEISIIGTSSMRRKMQAMRLYPDAEILPVRGNVRTRLKYLDDGGYSALIMSAAGLQRLGLEDRITRVFTVNEMLPAPGQGIIACQGRAEEDYSYLSCVNDDDSELCALAERSFASFLSAGCNVPAGAYASLAGDILLLRGLYVDDSGNFRSGEITCRRCEIQDIGRRLAEVIMS